MSTIWSIALLLGIAHAAYIYREETGAFHAKLAEEPIKVRTRAGYFAIWTLLLWATLGASVVIYWLIAIVLYFFTKTLPMALRG